MNNEIVLLFSNSTPFFGILLLITILIGIVYFGNRGKKLKENPERYSNTSINFFLSIYFTCVAGLGLGILCTFLRLLP